MWRFLIGFLPVASAGCSDHGSVSQCLAFRQQDQCVWDVASLSCVASIACEARSTPGQCESELTTGATWDNTQNQCFWDNRLKQCRWSEECHSVFGKDECLRAECAWKKVCTPQDMSSRPGPRVCSSTCSIPSADDILVGTRGFSVPKRSPKPRPKRPGSSRVVHTSTGPIQGNQLPGVSEFLGIPFAQAPVDQLRWAPSQKMQTWNQIFQATEFGAACAQQSAYYAGNAKKCQGLTRGKCLGYSEDCLTLNVWSPNSKGGPKAVMLWIHGGCYGYGSAADAEYNATALAEKEDVVVVSVQYRLGVFGFLGSQQIRSRDPQGSTGNWGLMDNIAALQWVQQNIGAFGGDPNRVTIFGESSGAGSVSLLLGVKESWPYYQSAIMESGTGSFWSYITLEAAHINWQQVLKATKCNSSVEEDNNNSGPVSCILSASSTLLTDAVQVVPCRDGCTWAPVLDGVFVPGTPVQLAKQGLLRPNTPSISGFNKNDGAMFVTGYPTSMVTMSQSSLDSYFSERYGEERKSQLQQLFPPVKESWWISKYFQAASACETDFSYSCTAQWISSWSSPSYVYKFSQPDSEGLTLHGDEIPYIFGTLDKPSGSDLQVSQWMMQYWANFAKTGDPNGPGLPVWPSWQKFPASLLNISTQPMLAQAPNNSWPGCRFFLSNWDFYSLCLPPTPDLGLANVSAGQIMV